MFYSRNERGALGVEVVPLCAVRIKDRSVFGSLLGLGSAADIALECAGDLGGAGAGNKAGYRSRRAIRFACLAVPEQFASEHQRITSPLPYVESLRWWLRPKKVARNVENGEASTLLRQRLVVRR